LSCSSGDSELLLEEAGLLVANTVLRRGVDILANVYVLLSVSENYPRWCMEGVSSALRAIPRFVRVELASLDLEMLLVKVKVNNIM
jgi:hypothetical protein